MMLQITPNVMINTEYIVCLVLPLGDEIGSLRMLDGSAIPVRSSSTEEREIRAWLDEEANRLQNIAKRRVGIKF